MARAERAGIIGRVPAELRRPHRVSAEGGGGFFPAPSTEKSAPYDSKRSVVATGPSMGWAFTLPLFSKG
ncbi:MAG: hypothetical protein OEW45_07445 [Deltaproteobacteria bacterium]|nr:hypothetical protein [Deltaproteobacteria bacterium]